MFAGEIPEFSLGIIPYVSYVGVWDATTQPANLHDEPMYSGALADLYLDTGVDVVGSEIKGSGTFLFSDTFSIPRPSGDFYGKGLVEPCGLNLISMYLGLGTAAASTPTGLVCDRSDLGMIDQNELDRVLSDWVRQSPKSCCKDAMPKLILVCCLIILLGWLGL